MRLRTPDSDMPTVAAVSRRVMPSRWCRVTIARVLARSPSRRRATVSRPSNSSSRLPGAWKRASASSSGVSRRRFDDRMTFRHRFVAIR